MIGAFGHSGNETHKCIITRYLLPNEQITQKRSRLDPISCILRKLVSPSRRARIKEEPTETNSRFTTMLLPAVQEPKGTKSTTINKIKLQEPKGTYPTCCHS
jgi:hypothetical protein